jgi:predicted AlkP superfamily phosphohydrolase/phosphomutase
MSSYLTFYGKKYEKIVEIVSFCQNSEVYQYFHDNMNISWYGEVEKYTEVTSADVNEVIDDVSNLLNIQQKRVNEYRRNVASNPDFINDILEYDDSIEETKQTLHYCEFIGMIVNNAGKYKNSFDKILCNIS